MGDFTGAERAFLQGGERRLARIATIGADGTPHVTPVGYRFDAETDGIEVRGMNLAATKKYRDLARNERVAIVVDDVLAPWQPRGIEVRGHAELVAGDAGPAIRIHPERIVSWGIERDDIGHRHARTTTRARSGRPSADADVLGRYQISEVLQATEIAIDRRDVDGFASHFTADARYSSPFGEHRGREAIAEMSRAHHATGSMDGKRRMSGPAVIEIRGDGCRAEAHSHWWVAEARAQPGVYSTGSYTDRLRREDGRWRIESRIQTIDPSWTGRPPA
jgi:pyridoxamine 5'-phosphate oxidase family protein